MIEYTNEEYQIVFKIMEEENGSRTEAIKVNAKDFSSIPLIKRDKLSVYYEDYKIRTQKRTLSEVSEKFRRGCTFREFLEKRFTDEYYKYIAKSIYNKICEAPRKRIAEEYPDILPKFDEDYRTVISLIEEGEKPFDLLNDFQWSGNGIADFIAKGIKVNIPLATDRDIRSESTKLTEYIKELLTGKKSSYEGCENNIITFFVYQQEYSPEDLKEAIMNKKRDGDNFIETLVNQLYSLKSLNRLYPVMQVTFDEADTAFRIFNSLVNEKETIDFSGAKFMLSENGTPVEAPPVTLAVVPEIPVDMLG